MKNACTKWKDALLEAALAETANEQLDRHLSQCEECAAGLKTLRARRQQMDALLPLVARAEEPSPNLHARIMAATEASGERRLPNFWPRWAMAGAVTAIVMVAILVLTLSGKPGLTDDELSRAQALAQWQAPTDVFLQVPGQEFLNSTPKLGESFLTMPMTKGDK